MKLVERHIITKNHCFWSEIDHKAFLSKNLFNDELMQDFIAIITSFCARLYGLRRSKRKTEQIIETLNNETS